jgi:osmoprotectant transport system permease protein
MNVVDDAWAFLTTGANWSGSEGIWALLVQQLLITVTAVGHRKDVYRDL